VPSYTVELHLVGSCVVDGVEAADETEAKRAAAKELVAFDIDWETDYAYVWTDDEPTAPTVIRDER
jgi:hypothetical protein